MFFKKFILISLISEDIPDYSKILEIVENYFSLEEGYSLDKTEILPFGFSKQTVNGINYRLLYTVKKNQIKLQIFLIL